MIVIALILFALSTFFFWPGILTPDSTAQFHQAVAGVFTDHHPPIMALYWRLLHAIVPGSGLMFLTQQLLLWGAVIVFMRTFAANRWRWVFLVIPWGPQLFRYEFFILKDVQFAFSFLFVAAVLSYFTVNSKRPSSFIVAGLLTILFYGTAVKYQAQFVLPLMTIWLSSVFWPQMSRVSIVMRGLFIGAGLLFCLYAFNHAVTNEQNYSWQFVKMYDLAAMSLAQGKSLFPEFVTGAPQFSMASVAARFNTQRVDDLFNDGGPLRLGRNAHERAILYKAWLGAVMASPICYLRHRLVLLDRLVTTQLGRSFAEIRQDPATKPGVGVVLALLESSGLESLLRMLLSFKTYVVLMLIYLMLGLYAAGRSAYAKVLMFLNGIGLMLIAVLGVFSMATDPRYIYLATCLHHFSHAFFFVGITEIIISINGSNANSAHPELIEGSERMKLLE